MPLQFMLVSDAMRRIARVQRRELTGFPVGQVVGMMNEVRPARDVILRLVDEYIEAVERLEKLQA
jgi:NAD(P)H-dependent flavin oxidoreductase YrpB (nitropropane dioxygenase family)